VEVFVVKLSPFEHYFFLIDGGSWVHSNTPLLAKVYLWISIIG